MTHLIITAFWTGAECQLLTCVSSFHSPHLSFLYKIFKGITYTCQTVWYTCNREVVVRRLRLGADCPNMWALYMASSSLNRAAN